MSYDIEVYGETALPVDQALALMAGKLIERKNSADEDIATIAHQQSGEYCFTIEGPYDVDDDAEDMREVDIPKSLKYRYSILVEGTQEPHVGHALRFGEQLALLVAGRIVDLQVESSVLVGEAAEQEEPKPEDGFLHVRWHRRLDLDSRSFAAHYIESASRLLPVALPFTYEPNGGKFSRDGGEGVDRVYREMCETRPLRISGRKGLVSGVVDSWTDEYLANFQVLELKFEATLLAKKSFASNFEAFFIELAERSNSFFAFAEINQSRYFTSIADSQWGEWPGLPSRAPWMSWFSPDYAELVRPHLVAERVRDLGKGTFYDVPLPPHRADRGVEDWVPREFMAKQDDSAQPQRSTAAALTMPDTIRSLGLDQ